MHLEVTFSLAETFESFERVRLRGPPPMDGWMDS
jgi:hypothetical protein